MSTRAARDKSALNALDPNARPPSDIPQFLWRTYCLLANPENQKYVQWTPKADGFIIPDELAFSRDILPKYFSHQQFTSFVRQLNFYNFHRRSQRRGPTRFTNPDLDLHDVESLKRLKRKRPGRKRKSSSRRSSRGSSSSADEESTALVNGKSGMSAQERSAIHNNLASLEGEVRMLKYRYNQIQTTQRQILEVLRRYLTSASTPQIPAQPFYDEAGNPVNGRPHKRHRPSLRITAAAHVDEPGPMRGNTSGFMTSSSSATAEAAAAAAAAAAAQSANGMISGQSTHPIVEEPDFDVLDGPQLGLGNSSGVSERIDTLRTEVQSLGQAASASAAANNAATLSPAFTMGLGASSSSSALMHNNATITELDDVVMPSPASAASLTPTLGDIAPLAESPALLPNGTTPSGLSSPGSFLSSPQM